MINESIPKIVIVREKVDVSVGEYDLITFNFSLEPAGFRSMIADIREAFNNDSKFFWDGLLNSWVVQHDSLHAVEDIALKYFEGSSHKKVESLKAEIREKLRKGKLDEYEHSA